MQNKHSVNDLSGIRWWMKKRRKYYFRNFTMVFGIMAVIICAFCLMGIPTLELSELLLVGFFVTSVTLFGVFQFKKWLESFHTKVSDHWYGTIVEMKRIRNSKKRVKSYRITADVDGKLMEGVCLTQTYHKARKGQRILLFTIAGDKVFCVHPEM